MTITRRDILASMAALAAVPARAGELVTLFESEADAVPYKFRRQEVAYKTSEPKGTIVVDPGKRFLYHVQGGGKAARYGVAVGRDGKLWAGEATIGRKEKWPKWTPTKEHLAEYPSLAKWVHGMPGGAGNPLGARAMYLYKGKVDTQYRIHGTIHPDSVGRYVTSGCIRMLNYDVAHLYDLCPIGTRVVVLDNLKRRDVLFPSSD
jgi:lipoprotein-anchoring transpeptidase ErfK/SrfK